MRGLRPEPPPDAGQNPSPRRPRVSLSRFLVILGVAGFLAGFVVPLVLPEAPWWVQSLAMTLVIMVLALSWGRFELRRTVRR